MGEIRWEFPLLGVGNESGSNIAAITMFKGAGIMDGLAREVCQNSLDAKNEETDDYTPVKVRIELRYLQKSRYPVFEEYEEYVRRCKEYWESSQLRTDKMMNFIISVEEALSRDSIPVLIMSDYNTTGLRGVEARDDEKSYWRLMVDTDGISIKDSKSSAGSYGIGKNAPFAYSALNLVFYNTLAVDGGRAFEGVARLATTTRKYKGKQTKTQPIGKYLFIDDDTGEWRPILPEDECPLAQYFTSERKDGDFGTDVAVFGFKEHEYPEWQKLMASAVIKNFVLSIYNQKLEVEIVSDTESYEINKDNLKKYLFETFKDESDLKYSRQIYSTFTEPDSTRSVKIAEEGDLTLYVKYKDTYFQSLSRFRSTGMLINTTGEGLPHFSVIVVVNDVGEKKLSTTLREAEPPQHTEWKAKNITDNRTLHNLAARYIREIGKAIQKLLDEFDKADTDSVLDAGAGSYLPDKNAGLDTGNTTDGLMTGLKVNKIVRNNGRVIYSSNYESAEGTTGKPNDGSAFKSGDTKRKKKKKIKLTPVTLGKGMTKGIAPGQGKVKTVSAEVTDHRTFYLGGNRYRLFADCPKEYDNLYIQYFATRDDMSTDVDALRIKSVKVNDQPVKKVSTDKIGPLKTKQGHNLIHVEFENHEIMAVKPVFTTEVKSDEE